MGKTVLRERVSLPGFFLPVTRQSFYHEQTTDTQTPGIYVLAVGEKVPRPFGALSPETNVLLLPPVESEGE